MAFSVAARIRGPPSRSQALVAKDDRSLLLSNGDPGTAPQLFTLDRVFGASTNQREVFSSLSTDLLRDFLEGVDVGIIAVGAAASGKSFSLLGDTRSHDERLDGLAARVLDAVLLHCSHQSAYTSRLHLSFVAIYDKYALDLLSEHQRPLGVAKQGKSYEVEGATKISLSARATLVELVQRGHRALVGSNPHLLLSLHLTRSRREQAVISSFRFAELMPAEFPLPRSVALLGACVRKLTDPSLAGQASFRDCLLTQVLKDALRGRFCMMACVDPSHYLASFHTLSFVSTCFNLEKSAPQHNFRYYRWLISKTAGGRAFVQVAFVQFLSALGQSVVPVGVSSPRRSPEAPPSSGPENVTRASGAAWIDYDAKPELVFDFGASIALQGYEFFVSPEAPEGEPIAWEFQASNDLKEWFVLDRQERVGRRRSSVGSFLRPRTPISEGYYQWYRWTITSRKPLSTPPSLQASRVVFYKGSMRISPVSVAESELSQQPPSLLLDGHLSTKWVKIAEVASLVFDFGSAVSLNAFEWFTAADFHHSDPSSWVLEGSTDMQTWTLLTEFPSQMPRSASSGLFYLDKKGSGRNEDESRELARLQAAHRALAEAADQATQQAQQATRLQKQAVAESESSGAALQGALQTNIQLQRKAQAAQEHAQQLTALSESQQQKITDLESRLQAQQQQETAALKPISELCQLILQFADPFMVGLDKGRASLEGAHARGRRRSHGALAPLPLEATPLQSLSHVHVFLCALKEEWEQLIQQRDGLESALRAKTEESVIYKTNFETSAAELAEIKRELRAERDTIRKERELHARSDSDRKQLEATLAQERQRSAHLETKLTQAEGNEKQLETWRVKCEELQASLVPLLAQRLNLEQSMTEEQSRAASERYEAQQQQIRLQAQMEALQAQLDRYSSSRPLSSGNSSSDNVSSSNGDRGTQKLADSQSEGEYEEVQSSAYRSNGQNVDEDLKQQLADLRQRNEKLEATQLQALKDIEKLKAELENQQLQFAEQLKQNKEFVEALPSAQQDAYTTEIHTLKTALEAQAKQLTQLEQEQNDEPIISPSSQIESALHLARRDLEDYKLRSQKISDECERQRAEIIQLKEQHETENGLLKSKIEQQQKEHAEYKKLLLQPHPEQSDFQLAHELEMERIQHKQHLEQWKAEIEGFVEQLEQQRSQHRVETEKLQLEHQEALKVVRKTSSSDDDLFGAIHTPNSTNATHSSSSVTSDLEVQHAVHLQKLKEQFEELTQQLEKQREQHKKQLQDTKIEYRNKQSQIDVGAQAGHYIEIDSQNKQIELLNKQIESHHQQRDALNQKIGALTAQLELLDSQLVSLRTTKQAELENFKTMLQTQRLEHQKQLHDLTQQLEQHKAASIQQVEELTLQHQEELKRIREEKSLDEFSEVAASSVVPDRHDDEEQLQKLKIELEMQQTQHAEQSQIWRTQLEELIAQGTQHRREIDNIQEQHKKQIEELKLQHGENAQNDEERSVSREAQIAEFEEQGQQLLHLQEQLEGILQEVTALRKSEMEAKAQLQARIGEYEQRLSKQNEEYESQLHELDRLHLQVSEFESLHHHQVSEFERQMQDFDVLQRQAEEQKKQMQEFAVEREKAQQEALEFKQKEREFEMFEQKVKEYDRQIEDLQSLQQQTEDITRQRQKFEQEVAQREQQLESQMQELEQQRREHERRVSQFESLQAQLESFAKESKQHAREEEERPVKAEHNLGDNEQKVKFEHQIRELQDQNQELRRQHDEFIQQHEIEILENRMKELLSGANEQTQSGEEQLETALLKEKASSSHLPLNHDSHAQQSTNDDLQSLLAQLQHQQAQKAHQHKQELEELIEELHWKQVEHEQEIAELHVRLKEAERDQNVTLTSHEKNASSSNEGESYSSSVVSNNSELTTHEANLTSPSHKLVDSSQSENDSNKALVADLEAQIQAKNKAIENVENELEIQKEEYSTQLQMWKDQFETLTQQFEQAKKQQKQQQQQEQQQQQQEASDQHITEELLHIQQLEKQIKDLSTQLSQTKGQLEELQKHYNDTARLINERDDTIDHMQKQHKQQLEDFGEQQAEEVRQAEEKCKHVWAEEISKLQKENTTSNSALLDLLRVLLPEHVSDKPNPDSVRELVSTYTGHKRISDQYMSQLHAVLLPSENSLASTSAASASSSTSSATSVPSGLEPELSRLARMTEAAKALQSQAEVAQGIRPLEVAELHEIEELHDLLFGDGKETLTFAATPRANGAKHIVEGGRMQVEDVLQAKETLQTEVMQLRSERARLQSNLTDVLMGVDGLQQAYLQQTLEIREFVAEADKSSKRMRELEFEFLKLIEEGDGFRKASSFASIPASSSVSAARGNNANHPITEEQTLFIDSEFPFASCLGPNVQARLKIEFRRPNECYKNPALFDIIEPSDVRQGSLGDCWLMSSFAALAEFPELIKNAFKENEVSKDGSYTCRLYDVETKRFVEVKIDDTLPCKPGGMPAFAQSLSGELWPCLLEKVFAKWMGSYSALSEGWPALALEALTGTDSVLYRFNLGDQIKELTFNHLSIKKAASLGTAKSYMTKQYWSRDDFFNQLKKYDEAGHIMTLATSDKDNNSESLLPTEDFGITKGHAYSLKTVREISGFRLCEMRNPWGDFEWGGDWSDRSELWKQYPHIEAELKPTFNKDDGMFWMPYSEVLSAFISVTVNKIQKPK